MADGLSHSQVTVIGQDQYGFMWIGTAKGLNIYDGTQMKNIYKNQKNKNSLSGNSITSFLFNGDSIWIGTRSGLCVMNVKSKECTRIDLGENRDIRVLYEKANSPYLWVGTSSGLLKYNRKTKSYQEFNTANSNISHDIIRSIYEDSDKNLWIGTFDGLNKMPTNTSAFISYDLKKDYRSSINNNLILSIAPNAVNNDSLLLVGTQTGLVLLHRTTMQMNFFREENTQLTNSVIKCIEQTNNGHLWLGTDFGLGEMDQNYKIKMHLHDPFKDNTLTNSVVWDIFKDKSGTLWFGTNNGISILSPSSSRFHFYPMTFKKGENIVGYELRDIMQDRYGDFWLSTQFGVVHYNPLKELYETFNSNQHVGKKLPIDGTVKCVEDSKGRVWIASNAGPLVWNPATQKLTSFTANFEAKEGLRSNYALDIIEMRNGTLLINTVGGLHRIIEDGNKMRFEYLGSYGEYLKAGPKYLWSFEKGVLYKINPETLARTDEMHFDISDTDADAGTLLVSDANTIWLGLKNGLGRYQIDSKEFNLFKIKSNKEIRIINLVSDNSGDLWGTSYSSILKFSQQSETFEIYPVKAGIPINRFARDCSLKKQNGDIIFGGQDGFLSFNPNAISKSTFNPFVRLTNLSVSNQTISPNNEYGGKVILQKDIAFTQDLTLEYSQRSFSLEFSSLHFGERSGIRYAYKLEGEDLSWHYLNEEKGVATYSNLNPGTYTFKYKGTNIDGVWNNTPASLSIKIRPPFWASPLLIVIYFILLVSIIVTFLFYYSSRMRMRSELKIIKLEKEHNEQLGKARQQFFTNIAHEFRTPLSLIIGPLEKLHKFDNDNSKFKAYLKLIENNARRLLWLNNQLLDFRQIENQSVKLKLSQFDFIPFVQSIFELFKDKADKKDITYIFETTIDQLEVTLDLRKVETIIFNLLANAFKFTQDKGRIEVHVETCESDKLCLIVKDSGIGIKEEDQHLIFDRFYQAKEAVKMELGSGIGLTLVNEYVKILQGQISLESQPQKGSEFKIELPIKHPVTQEENASTLDPEFDNLLLKPSIPETKENTKNHIKPLIGKPLILLVDDDNETTNFIRLNLQDKYNLQVANDGKEAIQKLSTHIPNLVITDLIMPGMNGLEFAKKFKSSPKFSHIPLIVLTGQTSKDKQLEAIKNGADAYVIKPFEPEILEARIATILKGKEQLIEYLKINNVSQPQKIEIPSQDEKILEKLVSCIERHISDPDLDIQKLCKVTGFSHSILYRKIKGLTGQTANEFIRTVRLRRAEQLLKTKKFTVAEVMDAVGFSNHSYFSKCFKRLYNMTPKEYIDQS